MVNPRDKAGKRRYWITMTRPAAADWYAAISVVVAAAASEAETSLWRPSSMQSRKYWASEARVTFSGVIQTCLGGNG